MIVNPNSKLVVIDMQNDFNPSETVIKAVCDRIEKYKEYGCKIYMTMDMHHKENYHSLIESKMFPPHCIEGEYGSHLVDAVGEALALYRQKTKIFYKESFGCQELARVLKEDCREGDTIELCGVCSDICVVSNALILRSALNNHELCIHSEATEGTSEEANTAALTVMRSCGITVL